MRGNKNSFRHESLQDQKTIQDMLKAVARGIAKGASAIVEAAPWHWDIA